ncbi:receptor-transporting protein 2-like [Pholidichthys leucotaenia]
MLEPEWNRIFQDKAQQLQPGDSWHLEFDGNIVPDKRNTGWQQYIKNTSASSSGTTNCTSQRHSCGWFKCSRCKRSWPSNRVMVLFHMCLTDGQGTVKVRPFRQNCKICSEAPMEIPSIDSNNIGVLIDKLVEKIKIKCYHEKPSDSNRAPERFDVRSPHEPDHCEGCKQGICTQN